MRTLRRFLFLLLVLPASALAQELCDSGDTIGECWDKHQGEVAETAVDLGTLGTMERLTSKATGLNELVEDSATEDFLPLLRFALAASGLQTESSDLSALSFERKIPIFDSFELKLDGKANDPEVYEPLKMAFGEDVRDDRVATLKEQFGDLDDYSLGLSLNRKSATFGRSPDETERKFLRTLFAEAFKDLNLANTFAALREFRQIVRDENLDATALISSIPENKRPTVLAKLAAASRAVALSGAELQGALEAKGFFKLGELLNNKPQIHGSATYRARKSFAGPDEISAKFTYEHDLSTNISDLEDECGDKASSDLVSCYETFISRPETEEDVDHGDRLTFSASFTELKPFRLALPDDQVDLDLDASTALSFSLKYGRFFDTGDLGPSARFDLAYTFEDVSDDPGRRDRSVASITFSNRFLRTLGLSLGLSYANHARFLPDTDEELSTHFGISYRMFPDEEEE